MAGSRRAKRGYGSGSIAARSGVWYGRWRAGRVQVHRKLGPVRQPGSREGLTRTQAEAALRRIINETRAAAPEERVGFDFVAEQYMHHLEHVKLRKASTLRDYRIILDRHLIPYFGTKPIDRITPAEVSAYMSAKLRAGLAVKTVTNTLNFAHGIFAFAVKRGWAASNVVAMTDRPRASAPSLSATSRARSTRAMTSWCSVTRRPAAPTTPPRCASASTRRWSLRA
jgi:integrase